MIDGTIPPSASPLTEAVAVLAQEAELMSPSLVEARARRWHPSPVPSVKDETGRKASGTRTDPTAELVIDSRRLDVSNALREAERLHVAVVSLAGRASSIRARLERAVSRYDSAGDEGAGAAPSGRPSRTCPAP